MISQGKVVALDRWGGKWNHLSMTHRLTTNYAKNYYNRTLIVKVIVENVVTCFWGTQCKRRKCKRQRVPVVGISGALTAVSAVQQLCKLLTSRVELIRSGASLALGYLSFDPEARRRLLNWCVWRSYWFSLLVNLTRLFVWRKRLTASKLRTEMTFIFRSCCCVSVILYKCL